MAPELVLSGLTSGIMYLSVDSLLFPVPGGKDSVGKRGLKLEAIIIYI